MLVAVDLTLVNFFSRAGFHPVWTVVVLAGATWYLLAVRRVRAAGGTWPAYRVALWMAGLVVIAVATLSGLTSWDRTNFTLPVIRWVLLGMLAPFPLVLSAPLHLALESGSTWTKRIVQAAVDSRAARLLTNPVMAWVLLTGFLTLVYFTGVFRESVRHPAFGDLIDLGFLLLGTILYTPAFGEDLPPRRMPPVVRMVYFLVGLPIYTIFGMALESQSKPLAPWLSIDDVHTGGGVMWSAGEIVAILSTIATLIMWVRAEERTARIYDATDEAEAEAQAEAWRAERRLAAAHAAAIRAGARRDATAQVNGLSLPSGPDGPHTPSA